MLRRLVPLLAAACACAGEALVIEAPGAATSLEAGGVVTIAGQGFVARRGDWLLTGEALRWDQRGDSLWASGGLVFVTPAVRLHAARIGLRPEARTGDAWEVEAWIERGDTRLRVRAGRVELRPDRLTFREVEADFGHGGILALHCPVLHVHLREQPRLDKGADQIDRHVEGIAAVRPAVHLAGVPVLWFPYLYRDYVLDYPWSTIEVGSSERMGSYLRYRVGSNLPEMAGWRTRIEARADRHTRAGNGFGGELFWRHADGGRGGVSLYRMARERVADPVDEGREGGTRDASVLDAAHYAAGTGWALAGRYTLLPDADPSATLAAGRSPDERFRADVQRRELEEKPFARRGGSGAWVLSGLALAADGERRPNDALDETERLFAAEISLPQRSVAGPLAVAGRLRAERLRQQVRDDEASRATWEGRLAADHWLGGVGLDAALGWRGVAWSDARIASVQVHGTRGTSLPFAEGGVSLRLVADDVDGSGATLAPRLGLELLGAARGAGNPGLDFRDGEDAPEADRRYLVTGLDGELHAGPASFTAEVAARWGLREDDRLVVEADGDLHRSGSALADVSFSARGSPRPGIEAVADGRWDARLARWTEFDARARWRLGERLELLYAGTYVPAADAPGTWLQRAGAALHLSRYRLDAWGEARPGGKDQPGGRSLDLWHLGLARRMVDGVLTVAYENALDPGQERIDHRFALSFTIGGGDEAARAPVLRAFGF